MTVSLKDKQGFVKWFLNDYQMKRRECVWILNYLLQRNEVMKNVHFVEDAHFCPKGMIMSTRDADDVPFRFYKNGNMTTDAERAFHDIRLNRDEDIYIQINFTGKKYISYLQVLEENDFIPEEKRVNSEDSIVADIFLKYSLNKFQRDQIMKKIDSALENGDKLMFDKLSKQLNKLENIERDFELITK